MKKSKKQSNLKVLATTSALIGVCCVGTGLNAETASASTTRISTINTSTQTGSSSLGTRLLNSIKRPFTGAGNLLGRAWKSLKSCFGLKSTSLNQDIEMQPVSNSDKSKTLKRGLKPIYSSSKSNVNNTRSTDNVEEILDDKYPIYTSVKKYNPKSVGSSTTSKQPDIHYADLKFDDLNSTSDVRPRTTPETIYTQVNTGGSSKQPKDVIYATLDFGDSNSNNGVRPRTQPGTIYTKVETGGSSTKNKITVTADVHTPSSGTTPPPLPPKSSAQKTGIDNNGFDEDNNHTKGSSFYQEFLVLSTDDGGSNGPKKPKRMFLMPEFETNQHGANPDNDPIYQPIGDFTSTSQTQTSSTGSGGGNKPPVPAPRTKLQTKQ